MTSQAEKETEAVYMPCELCRQKFSNGISVRVGGGVGAGYES